MKNTDKTLSVIETNTGAIQDGISKDTNYTDNINEKQGLQKASG